MMIIIIIIIIIIQLMFINVPSQQPDGQLQKTAQHTDKPDQHTNNINKGLYMQPQIHTAGTGD